MSDMSNNYKPESEDISDYQSENISEYQSSSDSEFDEDIENIFQKLIIEENIINDNEKEEEEEEETAMEQSKWSKFCERQQIFNFNGKNGINIELSNTIIPYDAFSLFVDEDIIDLIVRATNRYARITEVKNWVRTDSIEIRKFLGLILWFDFIKTIPPMSCWLPNLLYDFSIPQIIMDKKRFQLILTNFHSDFYNIDNELKENYSFLKILQNNFKKIFTPGENVIINEIFIPRHGKLIFNQYIPKKAYKYGNKLFTLSTPEGFTWSMCDYYEKSNNKETELAYNICQKLAENLFNEGRTLYIYNFHIDYELAKSCLQQKTHVVGIIRNNAKFVPKSISQGKLQTKEIKCEEDDNGIVIMKWKNSSNMIILSTKHGPFVMLQPENIKEEGTKDAKRYSKKLQPIALVDYNDKKCKIEHTEQLMSHTIKSIQGMNYDQKVCIHFLLGVSVVNAFLIYNKITNRNLSLQKFKEKLIEQLLGVIFFQRS